MMRFGRQILSWGETDAFRLLDNINPVDNSFGGFLIPLDERRVPLDMLLANYYFGDIGPFYEAFLEGYAAIDEQRRLRARHPRRLAVGAAQPRRAERHAPRRSAPTRERTIQDTRGGFRSSSTPRCRCIDEMRRSASPTTGRISTRRWCRRYVSPRLPAARISSGPAAGFLANAVQTAPRVQITGATATFALPGRLGARHLYLSGQPIIRYELAYFRGEPRNSQQQLDPFIYAVGNCSRGRQRRPAGRQRTVHRRQAHGDSWNFVLGIDTNQFIRWLNPNQSFFITTQFFYKHLNARRGAQPVGLDRQAPQRVQRRGAAGAGRTTSRRRSSTSGGASQSVLVHNPIDQYLQTLLISTSYYSGQVSPSLTLFYDWGGAFVAQPAGHLQPRPLPVHLQLQLPERRPPDGGQRRQPAARPRQRPLPIRIRDLITSI